MMSNLLRWFISCGESRRGPLLSRQRVFRDSLSTPPPVSPGSLRRCPPASRGAAVDGPAGESRSLGYQQRGAGLMDQCLLQLCVQAGGGIGGRDGLAVAVKYKLSFEQWPGERLDQ
jgi:hypothetical protein